MLDWLSEESSGKWHVDEAAGHAVHACTWWTVASEVEAGVADGESLKFLGEYGARHALMHAAKSGDGVLVHRVCTTLQLIRAGVEAGATGHLVRSAAACIKPVSGTGEQDGRRVANVSDTYRWLR